MIWVLSAMWWNLTANCSKQLLKRKFAAAEN
jgi:hypothetical protein